MNGEAPSPLYDQMLASGEAMFALISAMDPPLTTRERRLADMGIQAGVLGALGVLREQA